MNHLQNTQVQERNYAELVAPSLHESFLPYSSLLRPDRSTDLICKIFKMIQFGYLEMTTVEGNYYQFGDPKSQLRTHFIVKRPECLSAILHGGSLALGDSYVNEWWEIENDNLADFIGIILRNKLYLSVRENPILATQILIEQTFSSSGLLRASQKNIMHHYDLGNNFYQLMLDETMAYSCGYQLDINDSLLDLQRQKYELIANKLELDKGGSLLDVGCGWGGFLIYVAERYPNVTGHGITISPSQREFAMHRIKERGLENRITIDFLDFRRLSQKYDFIASIGMFEHVGESYLRQVYEEDAALFKENGVGLLHTIGTTEPVSFKKDPWIARHIFPGYRLPRLFELAEEMQTAGLLIGHIENLKPHYVVTLSKWRENVNKNREQIEALGPKFNKSFHRLWNYYLQCSEAGFHYGEMNLYQVLFSKNNQWNFPINFNFKL